MKRPLIRAVRGVLRYSTGGGGTCGAPLRRRDGRSAPAGALQAAVCACAVAVGGAGGGRRRLSGRHLVQLSWSWGDWGERALV